MSAAERIAKILRADKDTIAKIDTHLLQITGKHGVLEQIIEENETLIANRLQVLGVSAGVSSREIYDALISKIESDDHQLFKVFGNPNISSQADCEKVLAVVQRLAKTNHGFFLKEEKAAEFLLCSPPKKVMAYLGYNSVEEMLKHEDLFEVYSSLRFVEDNNWMNNVFFKQYETVTPDDFEEREIVVKTLGGKWRGAAEQYVKKKWHNISHLKELGVVFVIPISLGISGELLRMVSLILHYLYEVPFYSDMFRESSKVPALFSERFVSLLRGDVINRRIPEGEKTLWLVVQRYLAKDDENDWRLFVPHISPEAYHWMKAEESLVTIGDTLDEFGEDLQFWHNLGWVGDYFKDDVGNDVLVSFDLVDTVMSLVKHKELIKYLYHQQEALWNKIFMGYFGRNQLEHFLKKYLPQGYFEV